MLCGKKKAGILHKKNMKDLRTFKFADLTYRGTIEYRSACEQPITDVFTHAAFHAGLAEVIDELSDLLAPDHVLYVPSSLSKDVIH